MKTEKRVLAGIGAVGAGCMAGATALMGVDLATDVAVQFRVVGVLMGAVGTVLSAGVAYYKGALAE